MPRPEIVQRALEEIRKRPVNYEYFFSRLESPDWIEPLFHAGLFQHPPPPRREGDYISFSVWPESRYLARMARLAPETVQKIALQMPDTENVRVHEDLISAACSMPPELASDLARKEAAWVGSQEHLYLLLPEKLGELVSHLSRGGQIDVALVLARPLLAVLPPPERTATPEEDEGFRLTPEPRARFEPWYYEQILKKHIPELVRVAGERALSLLCDLLEDAIRQSRRLEEGAAPEDFSYIWRPAVEEHSQNRLRGRTALRNLLVSAVRDAAEEMTRTDPAVLPNLVRAFEERSWNIFHRLTLHLLRVFPDVDIALVTERLTDRARFDELGLRHEYTSLAHDQFGRLSPDDQAKILDWIATGPNVEEFMVGEEEWTGRRPTDEEAEKYVKAWRRNRLAPIRDAVSPEWGHRYDEWVSELGEPEHPDFAAYSTGVWVGPTSPKGAEDMRGMSVEEVISFLTVWKPSGDRMSSSPEGLGRVLAEVVAADPGRFSVEADRFRGLGPTYVRALLSGLRDAAKQRHTFRWPQILDLCSWVVDQPREIPGRKSEYGDLDPGWGWTRKAIADLLSAGFDKSQAEIPFDLRMSAWKVLRLLTDDPEPSPEYEERYGGSNMDPATVSINTARGEAMHAVVRYALWVRRHIEKATDGKERVARGFDEMPEVGEVLDTHLDPARDPSLAIRAVYGQWFTWIALLDAEWTRSRVAKIFPADEALQPLHNAAWDTYIIFCPPYDNVFELLQDEYARAVEAVGSPRGEKRQLADPEEQLADHLMTYYWRGKLTFDESGSLLEKFFTEASDKLRGHALDFIGQSLRNTEGAVETEIIDRLQTLWERRLNEARSAKPPASHARELTAFGTWFASAKFDDAWALAQLTEALKLAGRTDMDHEVVERLAVVAPSKPREAIECLRLIVEADTQGWAIHGWMYAARNILATALQSTDDTAREGAADLVHRLGARGYLEFRDLLSRGGS